MPHSAQVEYFCARDHVTRVSFTVEALLDAPSTWSCSTCHSPAHRHKPVPPPEPNTATSGTLPAWPHDQPVFSSSHHAAVQQRRSQQQAEEILNTALEKLRKET